MKHLLSCTAFVVLAGAPGRADAAPIFFTSSADFAAATSGAGLSVESFEAPFATAPTQTFPGFTVTEVSSLPSLSRDTFFPTLGSFTLTYASDGPSAVVFTFAAPINAFAIDVRDFGTAGAGSLTFSSPGLFSETVATVPPFRTTGNTLFFGVIDPAATFTQVTLTTTTGGDIVDLDRLQFGTTGLAAVPEPSGLALLGLGVLGLGGAVRRARARKA